MIKKGDTGEIELPPHHADPNSGFALPDAPTVGPELSPAAYVTRKHTFPLMQAVLESTGKRVSPELLDEIVRIHEIQQTERVAVAVSSGGTGLASFFEPGTRIQIQKKVREKIEQVMCMLGDAVIRASSTPVGIEYSNVDPETRCAAHEAHRVFDSGRGDFGVALRLMLEAFPVLAPASSIPGTSPWDAVELWRWAEGRSSSERDAVAFVLCVYNTAGAWAQDFSLQRAWSNWDVHQRGVVQGWLDRPWVP